VPSSPIPATAKPPSAGPTACAKLKPALLSAMASGNWEQTRHQFGDDNHNSGG
jgi:hypothetical protein